MPRTVRSASVFFSPWRDEGSPEHLALRLNALGFCFYLVEFDTRTQFWITAQSNEVPFFGHVHLNAGVFTLFVHEHSKWITAVQINVAFTVVLCDSDRVPELLCPSG